MLAKVVIIALVSAFCILVATRSGIREYLSIRSPHLLHELLECDLCISFWMNLLVSLMAAMLCAIDLNFSIFMYAILSTPITRILL